MKNKILIGTRESKLALYQSNLVIKKLSLLYPDISFEIKKIKIDTDEYVLKKALIQKNGN